jgi:septal ring factor EnvC (AmiA/AmiB activator)
MGNRFFKVLLIVLCCVPAGFLQTQESSPSNSSSSITVSKEQLDAIEKEIQSLRSQANRLALQENSIISMLDQYEVQSRMKAQEVAYFGLKQLKTEKDIEDLQAQFGNIEENLRKQEAYLSSRLVQAYKLGELNYLRLLLLVNSAGDLLRTYQYVSYLAKDDGRRVEEYKRSIEKMGEMQMRLQQEKRNLVSLKEDSEQAQKELEQSRREKMRLLTAIQTQREMHLNALTELKRASSQLQNFFDTVDSSGTYRKPTTPMSKLKGQLDWPVRGRIIQEFGRIKNPKFATTTISNGVEIAAPEGTSVHAVYEGEVVFSEWFKGYGKSIILSHPGGLYTLYSHNSELIAQRGVYVERGQVVAKVGSTGSLSGASLYFEIREKEQPVNPFLWLRKTFYAETQ